MTLKAWGILYKPDEKTYGMFPVILQDDEGFRISGFASEKLNKKMGDSASILDTLSFQGAPLTVISNGYRIHDQIEVNPLQLDRNLENENLCALVCGFGFMLQQNETLTGNQWKPEGIHWIPYAGLFYEILPVGEAHRKLSEFNAGAFVAFKEEFHKKEPDKKRLKALSNLMNWCLIDTDEARAADYALMDDELRDEMLCRWSRISFSGQDRSWPGNKAYGEKLLKLLEG